MDWCIAWWCRGVIGGVYTHFALSFYTHFLAPPCSLHGTYSHPGCLKMCFFWSNFQIWLLLPTCRSYNISDFCLFVSDKKRFTFICSLWLLVIYCPQSFVHPNMRQGKEDPVWHTARAPRNFEVGHPRIMVLAWGILFSFWIEHFSINNFIIIHASNLSWTANWSLHGSRAGLIR